MSSFVVDKYAFTLVENYLHFLASDRCGNDAFDRLKTYMPETIPFKSMRIYTCFYFILFKRNH